MAVVYKSAKQRALGAGLDLTNATVKAVAVDAAQYTLDAAHDNLDDVPSGARVATSPALTGKSITDGVFDAADTAFTAMTGPTVEAVIVYVDTGTASTSYLLAYVDSASAGLPFTPNGGDCNLQWDSGPSKIFAL